MAFKKFARKTYRRGRKAYRFAKKHQSEAKQALSLAKKVARMVNVEYKTYDYNNGQAIDNSGDVFTLFNPAQGDAYNERDGDSVKMVRCSGRLFITQNGSAQKTAFRVIIFRGKQENGNAYTVADILESASHLSPKAVHERFRTKIIFDKLYHMSNNGNSSLVMNYNFKMFGHTQFEAGQATIENGGLYMLLISNESTNTPTANWWLRTTFTDN